jgi:hypothetical protein
VSYFYKLDVKAFKSWLSTAGAEVLASSSTWEAVRFQARGGIHSVYVNKDGRYTVHGFALECVTEFLLGQTPPKMWADATKLNNVKKLYRPALLERDGDACFYCGYQMQPGDMTVEHLVSRNRRGPNHLDNMVLCHASCNQEAGSLPVKAKIELRAKLRADRRKALKAEPPAGFAKLALIRGGT